MSLKQKVIIVLVTGLAIVGVDQLTKVWARANLATPAQRQLGLEVEGKRFSMKVIGDRPGVEFVLSFNKGSAFGLFNQAAGARIFLSIIGIGALFLIFYLLRRPESDSKLFVWALAAVAGGAVGNLIDRIAVGQVTDFIQAWVTSSVRWLWPWPAFNVADIALVIGVILMVPAMLFAPAPDAEGESDAGGDEEGEDDVKGSTATGKGSKGKGGKGKGGKGKGGKAKGGKAKDGKGEPAKEKPPSSDMQSVDKARSSEKTESDDAKTEVYQDKTEVDDAKTEVYDAGTEEAKTEVYDAGTDDAKTVVYDDGAHSKK